MKCSVKKEVKSEIPPPKLDTIIRDTFKDSNVDVIRCYNLVFSFKNKLENIGFWAFSVLVFLHLPFFVYYFIFNISSIKKYIFTEMNKFHYLEHVINPPKKGKGKKKISKKKSKSKLSYMNKESIEKFKDNISSSRKGIHSQITLSNKNMVYVKNKMSSNISLQSNEQLLNFIKRKNVKNKNKITKNNRNMKQPIVVFDYKVLNNYINKN